MKDLFRASLFVVMVQLRVFKVFNETGRANSCFIYRSYIILGLFWFSFGMSALDFIAFSFHLTLMTCCLVLCYSLKFVVSGKMQESIWNCTEQDVGTSKCLMCSKQSPVLQVERYRVTFRITKCANTKCNYRDNYWFNTLKHFITHDTFSLDGDIYGMFVFINISCCSFSEL